VDRVTTSELYRRGVDAVARLDPYAGLLVSLHYSGFFHGHWDWQPFATPDRFPDPDRTALQEFVSGELQRQARLRSEAALTADDETRLAANYKWLQLWDRISLDICRQEATSAWEVEYPPTPLTYERDAGQGALQFRPPWRRALRAQSLPPAECSLCRHVADSEIAIAAPDRPPGVP
jgi:hypothetical protein